MSKISLFIYYIDRAFSRLRLPLRLKQYYIFAQPVPSERLLRSRRGRSVYVERLDTADPRLEALPVAADTLDLRGQAGNIVCFAAFKDGRVIGCHWLALDHHDDEEVGARFCGQGSARFVWDFDLYVVPEERIGYAFARIWDEAFAFLRELGIAWSLSYVSPVNQRSHKSHESLGSVRVASLLRITLGRAELIVSTIRPYLGLALPPRTRVTIPLPVPREPTN